MAVKNPIISLDLGTTKFCIAYLDQSQSRAQVKVCEVAAKGMRRGMLADFSLAKEALCELIEVAEAHLKVDIRKVVVGVAGSHLNGYRVKKEMNIHDSFIRQKHLDELATEVEDQVRQGTRELLHCVPVDFKVDDRDPIHNPIGMSGTQLQGQFFIIDADKSYLKDLVRLCNQCGLEVKQLFSEPFASASVTVHDQLKNLGVVVADIGGGTTDGIIFQQGRPVDMFTINTAGQHMNRDLSVGLGVSIEDGIILKETYGLSEIPPKFEITDIHGRNIQVPARQMQNILQARILEMGKLMFQSLLPYQGKLGGGIIFTGGGSCLKGLDEFLAYKFGISVRSEPPTLDMDLGENISSIHATVLGLANLELGRQKILELEAAGFWPKRYLSQFFNWIRELS